MDCTIKDYYCVHKDMGESGLSCRCALQPTNRFVSLLEMSFRLQIPACK